MKCEILAETKKGGATFEENNTHMYIWYDIGREGVSLFYYRNLIINITWERWHTMYDSWVKEEKPPNLLW